MTNETIEAYPLSWPAAWPRTAAHQREQARFYGTTSVSRTDWQGKLQTYHNKRGKTITEARDFLRAELDRLEAREVVISTNVELRRDGEIRGGRTSPADPGVAVYFKLKGQDRCFPCDKWSSVADNLWAIAKSIEAMRGLSRWGAERMVDAAFTGFKALPETTGGTPWWETLDCNAEASVETIRAQYRKLAMQRHPDKEGGSDEAFRALQVALGQGLAARGETR